MAKSPSTSCYAIRGLAIQLRSELKDICASSHYSILQDSIEAIKQFSWQKIILELQEKLPKLMLFLSTLILKSAKKCTSDVFYCINTIEITSPEDGTSSMCNISHAVWKWYK